MSRSLWRCRNPACPIPHGSVLGRVTLDDGLVLDPSVRAFVVYLDTRRTNIVCPECGMHRAFSGSFVRRTAR